MKRRNALKTLTVVTGGGIILPATLFTNCQSENYQPKFFKKTQIPLIEEISETILPETKDSPGAKSQKVANFLDAYIADCYSLDNQQLVHTGLLSFQKDCEAQTGKSFLEMTNQERHQQLVQLDTVAKQSESTHYFSLLKNLVLFAYFTSKEGAEKALRYLPIPGKYEGDYPLGAGDKSWALG